MTQILTSIAVKTRLPFVVFALIAVFSLPAKSVPMPACTPVEILLELH